jgi:hypothetical protein
LGEDLGQRGKQQERPDWEELEFTLEVVYAAGRQNAWYLGVQEGGEDKDTVGENCKGQPRGAGCSTKGKKGRVHRLHSACVGIELL